MRRLSAIDNRSSTPARPRDATDSVPPPPSVSLSAQGRQRGSDAAGEPLIAGLSAVPRAELPLVVLASGTYRLRLLDAHTARYTATEAALWRGNRPHRHAAFQLVLYMTGSGPINWVGTQREFSPGTLALSGPDEPHAPHATRAVPYGYKAALMILEPMVSAANGKEPSAADEPLSWSGLLSRRAGIGAVDLPAVCQLDPRPAAVLAELIDAAIPHCFSAASDADYGRQRFVCEVLDFLIREVVRRLTGPAQAGIGDERLDRAHQFIRGHFREQLTIADLANVACLSPSSFQRQFRRAFGLTPMVMQRKLRIECACRMLRETHRSIAAIAATLGYCDVYHFSRVFKQETGIAPGQYRKAGEAGGEG